MIAHVDAVSAADEHAFDRRRHHTHERALARRAGDECVELLAHRDATSSAAADLRIWRSTLFAASSCCVQWVASRSSSSTE